MFKFSLALLTGTLAAASVATAADLPYRSPPPVVPLPIFTWTGFYVGANVGAAFDGDRSRALQFPLNSIVNSGGTAGGVVFNKKNDDVGVTGGGQVGYNYQFGAGSGIVVGVEADAQYLDANNTNRNAGTNYTFLPQSPFGVPATGLAFAAPKASITRNTSQGDDYFGTVRGRIGYAFNRYLVYATGGFAYSGGDFDTGYAAGGGFEYAMTNNISVKLEGLYVDLNDSGKRGGQAVYNTTTNVLTVNDRKQDREFEVARVGINYKF